MQLYQLLYLTKQFVSYIANLHSCTIIIVIFLHNYLSSIAIPNKTVGKLHCQFIHSCTILLFFFIIISHQLLYLITQRVSYIANLYTHVLYCYKLAMLLTLCVINYNYAILINCYI